MLHRNFSCSTYYFVYVACVVCFNMLLGPKGPGPRVCYCQPIHHPSSLAPAMLSPPNLTCDSVPSPAQVDERDREVYQDHFQQTRASGDRVSPSVSQVRLSCL